MFNVTFSNIMATSFSGGRSRSTWRESPSVLPTYTPPPAHFDWYEAPKPIIQNTYFPQTLFIDILQGGVLFKFFFFFFKGAIVSPWDRQVLGEWNH
jgi:hypothetical protein